MSQSICISDKSISIARSITDLLIDKKNSVALLAPPGSDALFELAWNRSSILSCENIPVEMENRFSGFDQLVVFFDISSIVPLNPQVDRLSFVHMIDNQIKAQLLLISSLASYFKKKKKGRLVFVHKKVEQKERKEEASVLAGVAQSAFVRIAEEYAQLTLENSQWQGVQTLLLEYESSLEIEATSWLVGQIESGVSKNQGARWNRYKKLKLF